MGYEGHTLMIADPDAKRAAIGEAIGRLLERTRGRRGGRARLPDRLGGGHRLVPVHRRHPGGHRDSRPAAGSSPAATTPRSAGSQGHEPALDRAGHRRRPPRPDRAILDIGQKSVSEHRTPRSCRDHPSCRVLGLSAEHATVDVEAGTAAEDRRQGPVIPGYSDFTSSCTTASSAIARDEWKRSGKY